MPRRPSFLRLTLGVKLALVLLGVVTGALAVVYLMVVPRLDSRIADSRIKSLQQAAPPFLDRFRDASEYQLPERVTVAAASLDARVVVFQHLDGETIVSAADSRQVSGSDIVADPVAREAASTGTRQTGRVERDGVEYAEVATPLGEDRVVLFSAPLDDARSDVQLVKRSLVVAGLVALLAAAFAAYVAAYGLTRRIRRLETAARRIAAGDFAVPIDTGGEDEVAELAREFDTMRERLADLDRVRSEFIANASHELRTPLFSLSGFLELIADEEMDEETRQEFLRETRAQVQRLTRLATDLLGLSRLDAGQLVVERGDVDLALAARNLLDEFRLVADTSGHPLSLTAPVAVPATGDHERIVQIGRALVENALRHTPPGTPVELSAVSHGDTASFLVRDAGPGIPPEEQGRVFQRFYRAGGGKASGSGLGLAIAAELAAKMGGSLTVASQPGETTFTLTLPAGAATAFPRGNGVPARELATPPR